MKNCPKCRQPFAEITHLCPSCTAAQDAAVKAALRGGIKGALTGLLIGLVLLAPIVAFNEMDRGIKGISLMLPLASLITGFMLGMVKARKE